MTKSLILCCATGLAAFALASSAAAQTEAPKDPLTALFGDATIAKGTGVEVKRSQLDGAMISIKSTAAARGQALPPDELARVERQVLDRLIQIQLLLQKATDADKTKGKEITEKRIEGLLKRAGSEEAMTRQLKSVSLTMDQLRSRMTEEATAEAVIERELKINVTDEQVKTFYDENPARFEEPEMVRASHILLGTRDPATNTDLSDEKKAAKRKLAEALLKRARDGEDFAKLAREHSEDPGSKDKGGEYTFPRGMMVPEFESAAFSMKTNQISDIVTTQFGYHIIKLSENIPAKKVELEKIRDDLKEALRQQEMQKELPDYMAALVKQSDAEILDEKLKAIVLPDPRTAPGKPARN